MDKIEGIKEYLRKEIELTEKHIEEMANAKFYNEAALFKAKREGLIYAWNLIAVFYCEETKDL